MQLNEANQILQTIENDPRIFSYLVDGWCAWSILRPRIGLTVGQTDSQQITGVNQLAKLTRRELLMQFPKDLWRFVTYDKRPLVFALVASTNRAESSNHLYKDIYFDDILQLLQPCFKLELINNKNYLSRSRQAFIPSNMTNSASLLLRLTLAKLKQPKNLVKTSKYLYDEVNKYFPSQFNQKDIYNRLLYFYWDKKIYQQILKHFKPRFILLQTSYSNQALIAAAKGTSIPVIELQHGLIDQFHPGYAWSSMALTFKENMPIPDRIFVYGDYWKEQLCQNHFWTHEPISVGSTHIDQFRNIRNRNFGESPLHVVVTTQGFEKESLSRFLVEFIQAISLSKEIRLFIKLHPRETLKDPYLHAFQQYPNTFVLLANETPSTFELLTQADFHISVHSTCHYEALGLGVPTIILPFKDYQRILPLTDTGFAYLAETPSQMCQIIINKLGTSVPENVTHHFFQPRAKDNILGALRKEGLYQSAGAL